MFGIPGKQAVSITDKAATQIAKLMAKDGHEGLRIGVKKGGCAGMEYTMDYVTEVDPLDEVVEQEGARVMIAPMAQMFLFGTEIDYEVSLLESGFKFRNPNGLMPAAAASRLNSMKASRPNNIGQQYWHRFRQ